MPKDILYPVSYTHLDVYKRQVVLLSQEEVPPIPVRVCVNCPEFRTGSLVIILMVPAMAEEPNNVEAPPRITSTR